jgi:hypothetical protein
MITRKGMIKTRKNMITMEGDKQDRKEGSRAQGIVLLGRRQTAHGRGQIALRQGLNLKSCHILSPKEDN